MMRDVHAMVGDGSDARPVNLIYGVKFGCQVAQERVWQRGCSITRKLDVEAWQDDSACPARANLHRGSHLHGHTLRSSLGKMDINAITMVLFCSMIFLI